MRPGKKKKNRKTWKHLTNFPAMENTWKGEKVFYTVLENSFNWTVEVASVFDTTALIQFMQ